jgi:hypothetical protein
MPDPIPPPTPIVFATQSECSAWINVANVHLNNDGYSVFCMGDANPKPWRCKDASPPGDWWTRLSPANNHDGSWGVFLETWPAGSTSTTIPALDKVVNVILVPVTTP